MRIWINLLFLKTIEEDSIKHFVLFSSGIRVDLGCYFQQKIAKQGNVTNARDEEHLKQLIKVYKQMGGRKIKEGTLWLINSGTKHIQKISPS